MVVTTQQILGYQNVPRFSWGRLSMDRGATHLFRIEPPPSRHALAEYSIVREDDLEGWLNQVLSIGP